MNDFDCEPASLGLEPYDDEFDPLWFDGERDARADDEAALTSYADEWRSYYGWRIEPKLGAARGVLDGAGHQTRARENVDQAWFEVETFDREAGTWVPTVRVGYDGAKEACDGAPDALLDLLNARGWFADD